MRRHSAGRKSATSCHTNSCSLTVSNLPCCVSMLKSNTWRETGSLSGSCSSSNNECSRASSMAIHATFCTIYPTFRCVVPGKKEEELGGVFCRVLMKRPAGSDLIKFSSSSCKCPGFSDKSSSCTDFEMHVHEQSHVVRILPKFPLGFLCYNVADGPSPMNIGARCASSANMHPTLQTSIGNE